MKQEVERGTTITHKQETLEEAAINHCKLIDDFPALENPIFSFKEGAKWQQERSYSEEEVFELLENLVETFNPPTDNLKEWFEQFKKK